MNFWNIFYDLCTNVGKAPNVVAKELGISSASITWWKQGERNPSAKTLKAIADYFGVSIAYLKGEEEQTEKIPQDNISEDEKLFLELFRKLSPEKRQMLIDMLKIALAD